MLEQFIEVGKLDAKLLFSEDEIISYSELAQLCKLPESDLIKVLLYIGSDNEPFLLVLPSMKEANLEKLAMLRGCKRVREAASSEAEKITGYKKGVIPPISIYGVDIIVDSSILEKKVVACFGGEKNCALIINPSCIIDSAWEEPKVEDF